MKMENKGINETKDVVVFLAKVGVSIAQCVHDKKFEMTYFVDDVMALPGAIGNINEVPVELKDLDSAEAKELINAVVTELAPLGITTDEAAKKFIAAGISFCEGIFYIVEGLKLKNVAN
jgi:hypothetical protein